MDKHAEAMNQDQFVATAPPAYDTDPKSLGKYQPVPQSNFVVAQAGLPPGLYPHSFLGFSIFVSIFCGIFYIFTLFCSIPAITLSILSSFSSRKGLYSRGKTYGNVAAGLAIGTMIFGLVFTFVGLAVCVFIVTWLSMCAGFTGQSACAQNIWGLPA